MLFFLMRVDKRLRAQLFCLALIILAVQFPGGEGQDSSTTPAAASTLKCHYCLGEDCDDPAKVTTKDCGGQYKLCMSRIQDGLNARICNNIGVEGDCIFKLPDHCLNPKDAGQVDKVKECVKAVSADPYQSEGYEKVCVCEGDLCNSKNLPVGSTGGSGGSGGSGGTGGTDDANDVSTTANSTGGSPSNNPTWTFSFALGTVLASVVGILMTTATL